jgi:phosphatidylserine synthase
MTYILRRSCSPGLRWKAQCYRKSRYCGTPNTGKEQYPQSKWFFPRALVIVIAGVIRLAYFDAFGVHQGDTIAGLSLDITALVVSLMFLMEGFLNHTIFASLFYSVVVVMSVPHVAPFRMNKMVVVGTTPSQPMS